MGNGVGVGEGVGTAIAVGVAAGEGVGVAVAIGDAVADDGVGVVGVATGVEPPQASVSVAASAIPTAKIPRAMIPV